jgi:pimeloyl-ACP methyl ester carboxylesterase
LNKYFAGIHTIARHGVRFLKFKSRIPIAVIVLMLGCFYSSSYGEGLFDMETGRKTFVHDGVNISYIDRGSGTPMLMLHGFGASSYSWRYIISGFAKEYRVLAVDLKGFGLSDKPNDSNYSVKDQSNIIKYFIKENHLRDVVLVGNSFGGAVALLTSFELRESGNIKSLILLDSAGYDQDFPFFIKILRIPLLNRLSLSLVPNRTNAKMILDKAFWDDSKITEEMVSVYANYIGLSGSHHALIMTAEEIVPNDIASIMQKYKQITVPVLIIWGERDEIIPLSIGQRLAKDIPGARLQIINNCGHAPQEECPEETIYLIKNFLANGGMSN